MCRAPSQTLGTTETPMAPSLPLRELAVCGQQENMLMLPWACGQLHTELWWQWEPAELEAEGKAPVTGGSAGLEQRLQPGNQAGVLW